MRSSTWHAEEALLLLMSGGFFVHLISASRHLRDPGSEVGDILLKPVDTALFLVMAYAAVALVCRSRQFARTYDMSAPGRTVGYWAITAYVTLSLPGHALFLVTGNTRFFDGFPWWFSLVIMPMYVLIVLYIVTLPPQQDAPPPGVDPSAQLHGSAQHPVASQPASRATS
jgi:uncharacterized membrane protein YhdT